MCANCKQIGWADVGEKLIAKLGTDRTTARHEDNFSLEKAK